VSKKRKPAPQRSRQRIDNLEAKRQRFEDSGKFPWTRLLVFGAAVLAFLFGGLYAWEQWQQGQQVGGPVIAAQGDYPTQAAMTADIATEQTAEGVSIRLDQLKNDWLVGFDYDRTTPMPAEYQALVGGNTLPMLAYVAPSGRAVVATSFCEPCRSTSFHIEGDQLVCDSCFTRWDLNTLAGLAGGCMDYPPEEVVAEVRGDQLFIPIEALESWVPRAYGGAAEMSGDASSRG
jgi:uncharacterized protein